MTILLRNVGTGKYMLFVVLAWAMFFLLAALVLPPIDSHLRPALSVYRGFLSVAVLLAVPTVIVAPAYVYRAWLRLPTVPNRTAYGLWLGFESVLGRL